ncbi:chloramphenicol acetyltransferase [Aureisphaera galaxeae]|uniref:chloramphenicol acetyltransferase n=1 Tax=Aureisphaera galaxeae TaxID=1538023 RepID=UPI002350E122|nr:chloramphenicol acetyltransferase [Aureisphaera galaxeae]MDC8004852.1 chloramphenicol acetyltransferase [Aureisphaera galaxeae]
MKKKIDLEQWARKDHFKFFSQFEEPYHSITVDVDCTKTYNACKASGHSFFLSYLHKSLVAANAVPAFRLRIHNGEVYEYEAIHASPTIPRPDGTFGFSYIDFHEDFEVFHEQAKEVITKVENSTGLNPATSGENVIHYSSLPWLKFTSLSHARSYSFPDSSPKISFGKMTEENGRKVMPMSVHAHHGLVDGRDVGEYVKRLEAIL